MMKKFTAAGLSCAMAASLLMGAVSLTAGAAGYDGVTGYAKAYDFNAMTVGTVTANGGNTAASPIRGDGGYAASITDEWNYFGESGKSLKFDSESAREGCIQLELPHDETNGNIAFGTTAYNALVFAVKAPQAPAADADAKGYSLDLAFNDWGVYYKPLNEADKFKIQTKGKDYWEEVSIHSGKLYVPYGFEGLVKLDMKILYKSANFPAQPTEADYDNARLKDNEIKHEVIVEIWLPKSTGGTQGAFYLDDVYLRTPEATDVDKMEPDEKPETTANEFCDFEDRAVGDSLYDPEDLPGSAVWNGYNYTVTASDKFVGNGNISAEFYSEDNNQGWNIMALLKSGNGSIEGKKYLVFHIATPAADVSHSAMYEDAQGNKRFAFAILPKTETNGTGHWFKTNSTIAGNVEMLADGEATWKPIAGDDFYSYLPFGWSGWIKYDLSGFAEGSTKLADTMEVTGVEFYASQCGGRYGKVYLDSLFAMDDKDKLPCGISAAGDPEGTDPEPSTPSTPSDPPFIPDYSDGSSGSGDTSPGTDTSGNGSSGGGSVNTGRPFALAAPLMLAVLAGAGLVAAKKSRKK